MLGLLKQQAKDYKMQYPRTSAGFSTAFQAAMWTAERHPEKKYVLFVDSRKPREYSISLTCLVDKEFIQEGTCAHIIKAKGEMIEF